VVGMFPDATYGIERAELHPADSMIVFTDGVTEAANCDSEPFSERRLLTLLTQVDEPAGGLVSEVMARLTDFTRGAVQFDDITLLVVRNTHNGVQDKEGWAL